MVISMVRIDSVSDWEQEIASPFFFRSGRASTMTQTPSATPAALAGIRVIDMSRVFAAPVGAQILGDLGADVIKIEQPGQGDEPLAQAGLVVEAFNLLNTANEVEEDPVTTRVFRATTVVQPPRAIRFGLRYDF